MWLTPSRETGFPSLQSFEYTTFWMRGFSTESKYPPISTSTYFRFPPSSRFRLMTAWPVVPEPAKKSIMQLSSADVVSSIIRFISLVGFGLANGLLGNSDFSSSDAS